MEQFVQHLRRKSGAFAQQSDNLCRVGIRTSRNDQCLNMTVGKGNDRVFFVIARFFKNDWNGRGILKFCNLTQRAADVDIGTRGSQLLPLILLGNRRA